MWGLYDEPNGHGYGPDPQGYVNLVAAVGAALKAAGLAGEIISGPHVDGGFAILMQPGRWLSSVLSGGVLEYLDLVAVHPYRGDGCDHALPEGFCAPCDTYPGGCGPETVLADYRRLRALIAQHLPAGKPMPALVASEVGWSTCAPMNDSRCCTQGHALDPCGEVRCLGAWFSAGHRSETKQAELIVRQIIVDMLGGVAMTFIYDYKDDGSDPTASEQNFGVVRSDNSPKPAFQAAVTARKMLANAVSAERLSVDGSTEIFAVAFVSAPLNQSLCLACHSSLQS